MNRGLFKTVCYGLAVAMGVAVIITNIVAPISGTGPTDLLAIGVLALGVAALQK